MTEFTRRALVTGGTGSIGEAIVRRFCARGGCEVTFTYFENTSKAEELASSAGARSLQLNLLQEPLKLEDAEFDILVNSAGIILTKTLTDSVPLEELRATLQINTVAPFLLCQLVLPHMLQNRYGRIINIGSIWAERGISENSSYNVSKHALLGLTRSLAKEYAADGICANQVDPAAVESEIMRRLARSNVERGNVASVEEYLERAATFNPSGSLVTPDEVARAVEWLAFDASHLNGVAIPIDGGFLA